MHFNAPWHAQGLHWIANLIETAARFLERTAHEAATDCSGPNSVEEVRLRVHLRGL